MRVVAGETNGVWAGLPHSLGVHLGLFAGFTHTLPTHYTAFLFMQHGNGESDETTFGAGDGVFLANDGETITIRAGANGLQMLLLLGQPVDEPVAFGGPFVFNTQEQIQDARVRFGRGEMDSLNPSLVFSR